MSKQALAPVEPARAAEREAAFRLAFQHFSFRERMVVVANALQLIRKNEFDPSGILVLRGGEGLLGAMICLPVPGASGLVWPPQAVASPLREQVEDRLIAEASRWLQSQGAKLGQTLLAPAESYLAEPLLRNGFQHITRLQYLRHPLRGCTPASQQLQFLRYTVNRNLFHDTLLRTYEGTRDCPEVNGVRTLSEIIEGHQSQGRHDPDRWWLALEGNLPVGVLLLTEMPEWQGWDLSYVGVVPEARNRGLGRELLRHALHEASLAGAAQLSLAVDARNDPAMSVYLGLGFEPYDEREVFLAIWKK